MLGFIKFFLLSTLLFGAIGCGSISENKFKYYSFKNIFYDENKRAYILTYNAPQQTDEDNRSQIMLKDNHWISLKNNIKVSRPENITIENNVVKILDKNNSIIFTDKILLTAEDIEEKVDIRLPRPTMVFSPYISGTDNKWDRKSYIVNIGTKTTTHSPKSFTDIYCFFISKQDDIWNIKYIDERPITRLDEGVRLDVTEHDLQIPYLRINPRDIWLLDKQFSMCHDWDGGYGTDIRCFEEIDERIVVKKLFGDIVPKQHEETINMLMKTKPFNERPTENLFFLNDKKELHVIYNDKENAKGKYFLYQMYTKENPKVPINQQKIYWEQN